MARQHQTELASQSAASFLLAVDWTLPHCSRCLLTSDALGKLHACSVLQVTLQSWFFLSYLMDSLAFAANGLVADNLGRGDMAAARAAALRCLLYGSGVSVVLLGTLGTFPHAVAAIFTDLRCAHNVHCSEPWSRFDLPRAGSFLGIVECFVKVNSTLAGWHVLQRAGTASTAETGKLSRFVFRWA
jgi:hypothetical protein